MQDSSCCCQAEEAQGQEKVSDLALQCAVQGLHLPNQGWLEQAPRNGKLVFLLKIDERTLLLSFQRVLSLKTARESVCVSE